MAKPNISHFIVLMMENRAFDHIWGYRPGVTGLHGTETNLLDPTNPESDKNPAFVVSNAAPYAVLAGQGPGHSIEQVNVQLFNSKTGPTPGQAAANNGFVRSYSNEMFADRVKNPTNDQLAVVMESFAPTRLPS
ncbi:MAG TPA: alkaline phosphatase family protein, partial [Blastocatellia bacterium]